MFMKNVKKVVEFLTTLDEKDPFARFLESLRSRGKEYGRSLTVVSVNQCN